MPLSPEEAERQRYVSRTKGLQGIGRRTYARDRPKGLIELLGQSSPGMGNHPGRRRINNSSNSMHVDNNLRVSDAESFTSPISVLAACALELSTFGRLANLPSPK